MKRVLLVDTNFSSGPIYNYLVSAGYQVYVVGGNPKDFLAKSLPNYINIDYTNLLLLQKLINEFGIDYIVPGCNDRSYEVCSALNETRIFPGIDTPDITATLNNKERFRKFAMKHEVPVPCLLDPDNVSELCKRSIVVKPVDAFSGKGITVLHQVTRVQISEAIDKAKSVSRADAYIVEDFVEGQLYSHSASILNGKILVDFVVAEYSSVNPFVVDTSYVDTEFPKKILQEIRGHIQRIASILNLRDGLIHTQFIRKGSEFWFIEITRRCPGDLYSQLIELSTGYRYAANYARQFLGQPISDGIDVDRSIDLVIRHTITQDAERILSSIDFDESVVPIRFVPLAIAGDFLGPSPLGRVGILFTKARSMTHRNEMVERILRRGSYSLESLDPDRYMES